MRPQMSKSASRLWTRRDFLRAAGAGVTGSAMVPAFCFGQDRSGAGEHREVLAEAQSRIREYRMGRAKLKLVGPDGQVLPAGIDVQIRQRRHKFLFGCNIFKLGRCRTPEQNAAYAEHFADLLNFATLPFYWWNYERQEGRPDDGRTDEVVHWCKAHDVTTKGHPLAWNYRDPRWLNGTPQEVMQRQLKRIDRCVRRFRGDIDIWDVVNEATHYDRPGPKEDAPKLTEAIATMGVGNFLRAAFRTARQANPEATLLINDYRTDQAYADKVISQLLDGQYRPLYDVIGIQSHMHGGYWGPARTWAVCERFAAFGKPIHFTETTIVSGPKDGARWTTTAEGEERQARTVKQFYTILFSHPAVEAITWWDFSDQSAWQGAPAGLLRDDMTPKPAYEVLHELIKGQWWTEVDCQTNAGGQVDLDGFLGVYAIGAKLNGRMLEAKVLLDSNGQRGPVEVHLG